MQDDLLIEAAQTGNGAGRAGADGVVVAGALVFALQKSGALAAMRAPLEH